MESRFYLYISEAKVDMLLAQSSRPKADTRTTEVGFDVKIVKGSRRTETASGESTHKRLEKVLKRLGKEGKIGTVDAPGPYFRGRLSMRWSGDESMVLFGGQTGRTVVALGGSTKHAQATEPGDTAVPPLARSLLPSLLDGLVPDPRFDALFGAEPAPNDTLLRAVREAVGAIRGPAQPVEFVAKRLLHGTDVLLGSPLYVADAG
ncbi:DUF7019 family protein [Streptomyces sp. NPDC059853]|uniref:DUF7019 family protein n=1 Tax=Streptomyces sp. NPDC059853 TaxID=3346973 RepID=UPI0036639A54